MTLNPQALPTESGGSVRMALFEDLVVTAELEPATRNPDGTQVWTGHVVGQPLSQVTLVRLGDVSTGSISCAQGSYELHPLGGHQVQVRERDHSFVRCGVGQSEPVANRQTSTSAPPMTRAGSPPLLSALSTSGAVSSAEPTVDLYVVYNDRLLARLGSAAAVQAKVQELVALANTCYVNSQAQVRLNLVGTEQVSYTQPDTREITDADLDSLTAFATGSFANDRAALGADLVVGLLSVAPSTGTYTGGMAWTPSRATGLRSNLAFSVVAVESDPITLAHEVSHNFGCQHDAAQNPPSPSQALHPFAYGQRRPGIWATVMAYPQGSEVTIPVFSNPMVSAAGTPTGVAGVTENWRTLSLSAPTIAGYTTRAADNTVSVPLRAGWNALGLQRQQVTAINGTNIAGLAIFDGTGYQTRSLSPSAVNEGDGGRRGLFIYATASGQLNYAGGDDGRGNFVNLRPGWNLCSTSTSTTLPGSALIARQGGVQVPLGSVVLPQMIEIQPDNTYRTVDVTAGGSLRPGFAYWVFSQAQVQLTVGNP